MSLLASTNILLGRGLVLRRFLVSSASPKPLVVSCLTHNDPLTTSNPPPLSHPLLRLHGPTALRSTSARPVLSRHVSKLNASTTPQAHVPHYRCWRDRRTHARRLSGLRVRGRLIGPRFTLGHGHAVAALPVGLDSGEQQALFCVMRAPGGWLRWRLRRMEDGDTVEPARALVSRCLLLFATLALTRLLTRTLTRCSRSCKTCYLRRHMLQIKTRSRNGSSTTSYPRLCSLRPSPRPYLPPSPLRGGWSLQNYQDGYTKQTATTRRLRVQGPVAIPPKTLQNPPRYPPSSLSSSCPLLALYYR